MTPPLLAAIGAALAASGHGPLWLVPVWILLLWGVRTSETASRVAVTAPVVVALVGGLSAWPDVVTATSQFVRLALVGFALHFALHALEESRRLSLVLMAAVWLASPTPLGLLGIVLTGMALAAVKQRGVRVSDAPNALWIVGGFAVALAVLAFALPRPPAPAFLRPESGNPVGTGIRRAPPPATPAVSNDRRGLEALVNALLFSFAALSLTVAWRTWRERHAKLGGKVHWSDVLPIIALVGGGVMFLAWAALNSRGTTGGTTTTAGGSAVAVPGAEGTRSTSPVIDGLFAVLGWFGILGTVLGIVLLTALTIWLLRMRTEDEEARLTAGAPGPQGSATSAPLHRVREAYRSFLVALEAIGLARLTNETPEELARRVSLTYPGVATDLTTLTTLYEPVRYGGVLTEQDADVAERAVRRIETHLKEHHERLHESDSR